MANRDKIGNGLVMSGIGAAVYCLADYVLDYPSGMGEHLYQVIEAYKHVIFPGSATAAVGGLAIILKGAVEEKPVPETPKATKKTGP